MFMRLLVAGLALFPLLLPTVHAQKLSTTRTLTVDVGDTGEQLTVQAGDVLMFNLYGSAGTGYDWHVLDVNTDYLVLLDRRVNVPAAIPGNTPVVGGAGQTTTYSFYVKQALKKGGTFVSLPVVFVSLPPARNTAVEAQLIQFNLSSK